MLMRRSVAGLLLVGAVLLLACARASAPSVEPTVVVMAVADVRAPAALRVAVAIGDPAERRLIEDALRDAADIEIVSGRADADAVVSDEPIPGATRLLLGAWAVVTDQRRDVFEVSVEEVRTAFRGAITDWSELGGRALPLAAYVPAEHADLIAGALGLDRSELLATAVAAESLPTLVTGQRGALALVPVEALRPGLLALVVDGHDPYRDPADASPLRVERWIAAPTEQAAGRLAERVMDVLGSIEFAAVNPAGLLATGELVPVRCTNEALEAVGDFEAMFDGTRSLLRAADLTVMPLEVALIPGRPPTPCVSTFMLQGAPDAAAAAARAGVDVVPTIGNHVMDCWSGCSPAEALRSTLRTLDEAGLEHVGAGADLAAARAPLIVERDGVRFAFLGYDDIAPWYAAGSDSPGTAPLELATLAADVAAAAEQADHVVVSFNWGVEYTADPVARQREAAGIAVRAGASLVLGNHPHWVQAVEVLDGALIVYALGNFVFDQGWSVATTQGMVVEAGFTRDALIGYRLRPIAIRDLYRPEFVDPAGEGAPILDRVWGAADRLPARDGER